MMTIRISAALAAMMLLAVWSAPADAASDGTAEVRVETTPPATSGMLRFEGLPAGEVSLSEDGMGSLSAEVAAGRHVSKLDWIDPALVDVGYRLMDVVCDDLISERRSHGDPSQSAATFEVEAGETVACTFYLTKATACTCPEEGRWRVDNHPGSMVCSGVMAMTMPLKASRTQGTLSVNDGCTRIRAEGMSDDEADLDMALQPDCSWVGTVGGNHDGIPMIIAFRWNVENERRITGDLESTVSEQGMTCRMSRTYQLDYEE
jgi:hypothetical protein